MRDDKGSNNQNTDSEYVNLSEAREKIKELEETLEKSDAEKRECLEGWQRIKADYLNARKNEEIEKQTAINRRTENIIKEFLEILDALDSALKGEDFKRLEENHKKGIEAIFQKFLKIIECYNVKPFSSINEKFNPERHEALSTKETNEKEKDNIVLEEFQKGYIINNKILRPAKVKVGIYKENLN